MFEKLYSWMYWNWYRKLHKAFHSQMTRASRKIIHRLGGYVFDDDPFTIGYVGHKWTVDELKFVWYEGIVQEGETINEDEIKEEIAKKIGLELLRGGFIGFYSDIEPDRRTKGRKVHGTVIVGAVPPGPKSLYGL